MSQEDKKDKVHKAEVVKPEISNEKHYIKPPSFLQMAKTFTTELATYIKNGAPNVSAEEYKARLDICKSCEHLIEKTMRCGACGCLLEHKAKWKTTSCPKEKWAALELTKDEQKLKDDREGIKNDHVIDISKQDARKAVKYYTQEEYKELMKNRHAERQENNNTDSSD
tara:strand:+ start:3666 stop:4169 length:504 start_codon:yes stop_codon:yes gene_type:complete